MPWRVATFSESYFFVRVLFLAFVFVSSILFIVFTFLFNPSLLQYFRIVRLVGYHFFSFR